MQPCIFDIAARLTALKDMITDKRFVRLVNTCIPAGFYDAPGAMKHHHAFRHGLSLHTAEVAEVAVSMLECSGESFTDYDFDVLLTASLLHDLGKVWEYNIDLQTDTITYGSFTIGHVVKSVMYMVECNATMDCESLKPHVIDDIAAVMLAHHGFSDWGTPKNCAVDNKRATLLQAIIHSADMVSAGK